ncbi:MAG: dihydroorotate dehydrogenase [Candidatus Marinimicrobia bacterium]|jgi:dihydroorotate dehydrogenase (NAD+) catalytic subunit|nr:dihydroorotate dehydrogenase [Candidatus Neomarinimicrobiota bacterium]MBT3675793.1 dihydroorotate dehydrogenase [Candidatus Neomarinimicrobiota bacterium]MBT3762955.1 dihydroorotate dehydrogenase [Candidatus Neomarinimicrobiota bacterium]MBT4271488.1 dihydroorotate dehydrogenase [Candidatus Neomarinimicrobiota bacterium]MBT4371902.1 dihydroorotate dehydrogenase [Candidatus Neomarinimicrobiota bacterium]
MKQRISTLAELKIKIGNETFENPIWVASGTFGYGTEAPELVDVNRLGAIVTKSITRQPREGNPPPRIVETPSGMINSIGLANIGVEKYIQDMLPIYERLSTKIIMNIAGTDIQEYVEIMEMVESVSSAIVGYEINISCPNVKKGGMEFGVDCDMTAKLTEELRKLTDRLIIMKLSPNVSDVVSIGMSAQNAGADAVSAINTVVGMSINSNTGMSNIYTTYGGLSGPAIKPVGLAMVHKLYQKLSIPIVGMGGIVNGKDAVEYMMAGSTAVQVGTANFRNPGIGENILDSFDSFLDKTNRDSAFELIGSVKTHS